MSESSLIVTQGKGCPFCSSSVRTEIDSLIRSRHILASPNGEGEGEVVEVGPPPTYGETLKEIDGLLSKLPNSTSEYTLTDLIIHATRHPMITTVHGLAIRKEGNILLVGERAYQVPDLQDALLYVIAVGLQRFSNPREVTPTLWAKSIELLWRMNAGLAGSDEFLQAIVSAVRGKTIPPESPLGKAYFEREEVKKAVAEEGKRAERDVLPQIETVTDGNG